MTIPGIVSYGILMSLLAAWAAFAALSASVRAQEPATAIPNTAACAGREAAAVREAGDDVRRLARSCLVERGLNRDLGARMIDLLDRGRVHFSCGDASARGTLGETWAREADADVTMVTWPPRDLIDGFPDQHVFTLFHELIHAVDPEDRRMLTQTLHNFGGFPDGVYGCELACLGSIPGERIRRNVLVYQAVAEADIPEKPGWNGTARSQDDRKLLRQLSWVCQNNGPFVNAKIRQRTALLEQTLCAVGGFPRCEAPVCAEERDAATVGGRTQTPAFVALVERIYRIARALDQRDERELSGQDSRLAVALRPIIEQCRADPSAEVH